MVGMRRLHIVLGFALAAGPLCAEELTADEIVRRGVERAERQYQSFADARFRSRVESEIRSLGANKEVTETETATAIQYPVEGALFEELIATDGEPLSEKEKRNQSKLRKKFAREVEMRRARGEHPQPEKGVGVRFNQELVERYRLEVAGEERVRGHDCWVIAFEPKSGDLPVRKRIDAALNKSTGQMWISKEDFGLVELEFGMREPYKYWGGFLATINNTDGRLEFERIAADVWVPKSFDLRFDIKVLMVQSIRRHITRRWREYRLAESAEVSQIRSESQP